jgi:carbon monoxide dehydrogenase subunit G
MKVKAKVERELNFSSDKVWRLLEDFGNIHWAPGIDKLEVIGEGVGMIRRIHIDGLDSPIDEVLESIDSHSMAFSYSIPRGLPFPLSNYQAFAKAKSIGTDKTLVQWQSDCEPDGISHEDATNMLVDTYNQLIGWINDELNRRHNNS